MIIVGAGIIGLSCAWRLSQQGVPVTVLEAGFAAREASWAGAGMLAPGGEIESDGEAARLAVRSLAAFPLFVEELLEESGLGIDFQQNGAIEVAFTPEEAVALDHKAMVQAALGIPSAPCAFEGVQHARRYPADALVNPRDVTAALRVACERRGVKLVEQCQVDQILEDGSVLTSLGEYSAATILVTAGAWSSSLLPEAKTFPVRGHLLSYGVVDLRLGGILRHGSTYLLQRTTGELIAGATTENVGFNREINESALGDLQARAEQLLPALRSLPVKDRWNGLRPGIQAASPWIGHVRGRIWGAFGHYRNGILLAPETGRIVAEMLG